MLSKKKMNSTNKTTYVISVICAVSYGLFTRLAFGLKLTGDVFEIMSSSFIIGILIVLGFISIWFVRKEKKLAWYQYIVLPWISGFIFLACTLALVWEGIICIILWLPLVMILSTTGGLIAALALYIIKARSNRMYCVSFVCLLPFILAPIENLKERASDIRTVHSRIIIEAPIETVWKNIERVPAISEYEHRFALVHLLGFPRPVEAKLIGEGIGAIRHAIFEGNVLFLEHVTEWEKNKKISFTITANTENIPPDTFDEHVTIGGPYFDVLDGGYEIEKLEDGRILLLLKSQQRLSTNFNFYSYLWTEWLMKSIQDYILVIIKERCEAQQVGI